MKHVRQSGFTLVELMVSMAIGLVLSLAVGMTMISMGQQFRSVGASSAAQVGVQLALSLVDAAGREAGTGLFSNGQPLCQQFNAWRSGTVVSNGAPLLPARIVAGGTATASDRLIFTASNATGPLSAMPVLAPMASADAALAVTDSGLLALDDLVIVGVPGSTTTPCSLFQVTATPTTSTACGGNASQCKTVTHSVNASYNAPASTFTTESRYGFASAGAVSGPAVVYRLGPQFRQDAFAVLCETLVRYNHFSDNPGCGTAPLSMTGGANALVPDVVLMKAQYGVSASASSDVVNAWVDASGSWASPGAGDIGRIKAVRVVIVSRAKERGNGEVTAASCTNGSGVVNTGPCSFDDAQAPVIDLSQVSVPSGATWRQYRYRAHQAVIPLRNVIWSAG
jgi:type IV pilus assembly protein PilW